METVEVKLSEIVFDETIYPRSEHNPAKVQEYAENIEAIEAQGNFISVDSTLRLLDGRHRHLAYLKNADGKDYTIKVFKYEDGIDSRLVSIRLNSSHGQQLSQEDKRRNCISLFSAGYTIETIKNELSVSHGFAQRATKHFREEEEKRVEERILNLWLGCHSETDISEAVKRDQKTVNRKIETFRQIIQLDNLPKSRAFFADEGFKPPLYNVWKYKEKTTDGYHFGNSEKSIVDNLIYLYTEPFDIIVDPFAGGGSTIDRCKERSRRYYVSDLTPIPARQDIRQHDITTGLPDDLPVPNLIFHLCFDLYLFDVALDP